MFPVPVRVPLIAIAPVPADPTAAFNTTPSAPFSVSVPFPTVLVVPATVSDPDSVVRRIGPALAMAPPMAAVNDAGPVVLTKMPLAVPVVEDVVLDVADTVAAVTRIGRAAVPIVAVCPSCGAVVNTTFPVGPVSTRTFPLRAIIVPWLVARDAVVAVPVPPSPTVMLLSVIPPARVPLVLNASNRTAVAELFEVVIDDPAFMRRLAVLPVSRLPAR